MGTSYRTISTFFFSNKQIGQLFWSRGTISRILYTLLRLFVIRHVSDRYTIYFPKYMTSTGTYILYIYTCKILFDINIIVLLVFFYQKDRPFYKNLNMFFFFYHTIAWKSLDMNSSIKSIMSKRMVNFTVTYLLELKR